MIRNCLAHGGFSKTLEEKLLIIIEPPEGILKEQHEEWMFIDEDIPVIAILTDLQICHVVCEQDQAINIDDSEESKCVEVNPPTNTELMQTLDILKCSMQHRSTYFKIQYK
ncbi:hypothetical protein AVEN_212150-1 [Araneus ventricosus]|uniref:Uncharacterized protein n=1 Tax=Araneus ventricosus TaxID=182803 RepID=A0A4Y2SCZ6_ARAVE|nr:hypothetical protein AVEN_212150-1 [Araneus ventricosus]